MSQSKELKSHFTSLLKLPWTSDAIPGVIVENVIALAYAEEVLDTYDFVDVIDPLQKIGWQVKSTKENTPVTWRRAKIPNKQQLIDQSKVSEEGLQGLGDAILDFCNEHAHESLEKYDLSEIRYARCILLDSGRVKFFERTLCTTETPDIFDKQDFYWRWSKPKKTSKKEQLPALHGLYRADDSKAWAWHGHGENQLHFSGEQLWWSSNKLTNFEMDQPKKLSWNSFFEKMNRD